MLRGIQASIFLFVLSLGLSCTSPQAGQSPAEAEAFTTWQTYGGDKKSTRYAAFDQINRSNVDQLEVAWTYRSGDMREDSRGSIQANPIVVDGVMYVTSPSIQAIALNAETGEEIWRFDPFQGEEPRGVNRGVTYWTDGEDKRIFVTAGWNPELYALDAETGEPIASFGDQGVVNIAEGIVREGQNDISATTPGIIYDDLLILGTRIVKSTSSRPSPGDVAAYNVRTGEREWIFHTIPREGEFGNETWEDDSWKHEGGANAWGGMSVDEERGIVFLPVTTPGYSFYGGTRPGKNLFSNSVVALDAATGERIWHYQLIHHGIWDKDPAAPPVLATVEHDGRRIDAVAQASKRGDLFLLDRETGEPLFEVEEREVPQSDLPGEQTWPTQPFPVKPPPFTRQGYTEDDLPTISDEAYEYARQELEQRKAGHPFTPPSEEGTIMLPGLRGGAHWGGAAFDPTTGYLYINDTEVPWVLQMREADSDSSPYPYLGRQWQFVDPEGYPAIKPPWGKLNAIDLNSGEIVWQVPLGEYEALTERGIPPTGTDNLGGPIVTAGGLVFIGATKDEKFRAFDADTGEILWETDLPAGGYATPATYQVNGKQYVVISAGGGGLLGTEQSDAFVAFALP